MTEQTEVKNETNEILAAARQSEEDIRVMHMQDFVKKWQQVTVDVPATFLHFGNINRFVADRNPDALGHWDNIQPASPDSIKQILGFEVGAAFIDWLIMTRTTYVLQQMSTNMMFKFIDMAMDAEGNFCYNIVEDNPEMTPEIHAQLERVIAANARI